MMVIVPSSLRPRANYLIRGSQHCSCSLGTALFSVTYYKIWKLLFLISHCLNPFYWVHFNSSHSRKQTPLYLFVPFEPTPPGRFSILCQKLMYKKNLLLTSSGTFLQDRKLLLIFKYSLWTQGGKGGVTSRVDHCIYVGISTQYDYGATFCFAGWQEPLFCLMKHLRMTGKSNATREKGWNHSKASVAGSSVQSRSCCCHKIREVLPCHVLSALTIIPGCFQMC